MLSSIWASLQQNYHWQLSLYALVPIMLIPFIAKHLLRLVPAIGEAQTLNKEAYEKKMARPVYAANQKRNRKWGFTYLGGDLCRHRAVLPDVGIAALVECAGGHLCHPDGL